MTWEDLKVLPRHLTDKFANGYWPLYQRIRELLPPDARVLEVGVLDGGSLTLWQHLFPKGLIAGADNDPGRTWPDGTIKIIAGQDDPALAAAARDASPDGWDLIIDDASHVGHLSRATFSLLWPLVAAGGWYVFEDWAVGVPGNEPYFGNYDGTSQLDLAQDLLARAGRLPSRGDADVEEFLGRPGIIALRKMRDA